MSQNEAPNNIIRFPGPKKESDNRPPPAPVAKQVAVQPKAKKKINPSLGAFLAIALLSGLVNHYSFHTATVTDMNSSSLRSIASVEPTTWERDATWEKNLAESLASVQVRGLASTNVGRAASTEDKLRWGALEEKYTILYQTKRHIIDTIILQDSGVQPSYILDRQKFLQTYGSLMAEHFNSAELKSVELNHDKTIEDYTLFDQDKRPSGQARFELDMHKRLLSLRVEPAQI